MVAPVAAGAGVPVYLEDMHYRRQLQAELLEMEALPPLDDPLAAPISQWVAHFKAALLSCRARSSADTIVQNEKAVITEFVSLLITLLLQSSKEAAENGREYPVARHMLRWLKRHIAEPMPQLEVFEREAPAGALRIIRIRSGVIARARAAARPRDERVAEAFHEGLAAMREAVERRLAEAVPVAIEALREEDARVGAVFEEARERGALAMSAMNAQCDETEALQAETRIGIVELSEELREHQTVLNRLQRDNVEIRHHIEDTRRIIQENKRSSKDEFGGLLEGLAGIAIAFAIAWVFPASAPTVFPGGGSATFLAIPL